MTRKRRRLAIILIGFAALAGATVLVSFALQDNLKFFFSPSELAAKPVPAGQRFRIGGMVEANSLVRDPDGLTMHFWVTDGPNRVRVRFKGLLPDLFREGQGVVADGHLNAKNVFVALEVLAKHDENYMPAEVAEALKKTNYWQGEKKQPNKNRPYGGDKK